MKISQDWSAPGRTTGARRARAPLRLGGAVRTQRLLRLMQHLLLARWHLPARIAVSAGVVGLAALLRLALYPVIGSDPSWGTFYVAVLLAALATGMWGGVLALAASVFVSLYFFIAPHWEFGTSSADEITLTAVFVCVALVLTVVGALLRSTAGRLASARETAQRRAERLRIAAQAARMGTWDVELPSGRMVESDEVGGMFGRRGPAHADLAAFAADVHPDDRERVMALFNAAIAGAATFHTEFRTRLIDGAERYIESAGTVLRDARGIPYRVIGCAFDVTERRAVEAERADLLAFADAARSEAVSAAERVSGIIESVTDGFFALDAGWRFVYANAHAGQFFDRPRAALLGEVVWRCVPPEMSDAMHAALQRAVAERQPTEAAFQAPGGRWIELHAFPAAQQLNVFVRDVTDRHAAAEALRESEQRFRSLADESPVLMWTIDPARRFEFVNETCRAFVGVPFADALVRWRDALHPDDAPGYWAAFDRARAHGDVFRATARFRRHDGEWRWIESVGVPRRGDAGRVLGYAGSSYDVTEQRQATAELRASREHLQAALRHVEYVTDRMAAAVTRCSRDMRYLWASRRYASWLGLPHEAVVGRPIVEVVGEEAYAMLLPHMARVLQGARVEFELELPLPGARRRWIHGVYEPTHDAAGVPDGWIAVITDITERKALELEVQRAEEAARARSAELETILDILPVGVAIAKDPRAETIVVNASYERLLGVPPGTTSPLSSPPGTLPFRARRDGRDLAPEELPMQQVARTGVEVHDQPVDLVFDDGREINLSVSAAPLFDSAGVVRGVIGAHVDITEHRRVTAELRDADRRKDEFLAMLAHELRNPLAPVRNAVEVLRAIGPRDAQLVWARDMIDRQVRHMTRLVDDLLEVSRITRGKITLRRSEIQLADVVGDAIETARPLIAQHGHHLVLALAPEPLPVDGDRARLVQVLANLLSNAAKFTPPGGEIRLTTAREDAHAVVRVRDTGIGIPPELQTRIFEIFTQEESTLARSQGGLGIGLTLAQRLVELHGGALSVASEGRGRGAEFTVRLPLVGARDDRSLLPAPPAADSNGAPRGRRVLIVEDNVDAADSFQLLLELGGHEVRVAHLGRDALRLLDAFTPDIAFIDLGLPEMSGFEVAERLRRDPRARGTVLVAVSGYGRDEDKAAGRRAGFHHHLTKPVDLAAVTRLFDSLAAPAPTHAPASA